MPYGDSKTYGAVWPGYMIAARPLLLEEPARIAVSGRTTALAYAAIDAELLTHNETPVYVLYNLGVNDALTFGDITAEEADWKTQTAYILDAMNTKWPTAKVYIMYPWCAGQDADCDLIATWFDDLRAARSAWVKQGPDERVWLKGADNGATMTTDGTHYSTAGKLECAAQWLATLP
jgi:hypothetical protein